MKYSYSYEHVKSVSTMKKTHDLIIPQCFFITYFHMCFVERPYRRVRKFPSGLAWARNRGKVCELVSCDKMQIVK